MHRVIITALGLEGRCTLNDKRGEVGGLSRDNDGIPPNLERWNTEGLPDREREVNKGEEEGEWVIRPPPTMPSMLGAKLNCEGCFISAASKRIWICKSTNEAYFIANLRVAKTRLINTFQHNRQA